MNQAVPFECNMTKSDWILKEPGTELDNQQLFPDLMEFLKPNESNINGREMRQRAKKLNAYYGQRYAEYLLRRQDLLLREWRGKFCLVFPATVWQSPSNQRRPMVRQSLKNLCVPVLRWYGDQWYMHLRYLDSDWGGCDRLIISHK